MKPLRAFPFPLNIGTDICQISRVYQILSGPRATKFVNRILSPEERQRMISRGMSLPGRAGKHHDTDMEDREGWKSASFLAGRFAAKEAAIKAHSHRRLTFHDVVIEPRQNLSSDVMEDRLGSGPPVARIRAALEGEEDVSAMVSISHDGDYATAVCLAHDPSVTV